MVTHPQRLVGSQVRCGPLTAVAFALLASVGAAQESSDDSLSLRLLEEVRALRAEVNIIRSENQALRQHLEILARQLGIEVEVPTRTAHASTTATQSAERAPKQQVAHTASQQKEPAAQPVEPPAPQDPTDAAVTQTEPSRSAERETSPAPPPARSADPPRLAFAAPQRARGAEREAYLDALAFLDTNDYQRTLQALQQFLKDYPAGAYAPKARYWIAESYYTERQYDQAAQHFSEYVQRFPDSGRTADAQLKLAYIYQEQGDLPAARQLLEALTDSSNQRVRVLAQRRLQRLSEAGR